MKNWIDAENEVWLDKQMLANLDPVDKLLAKSMKVGYQGGKGLGLVPVLFPADTHLALQKMCDAQIRQDASVAEGNNFLFPSIRSMEHVSGWHALHRVCKDIGDLESPDLLTATKNRHRVSIEFSLLDLPEGERGACFKHLGHSEEVNKHVYQAPLALREITTVGKLLADLDTGKLEK